MGGEIRGKSRFAHQFQSELVVTLLNNAIARPIPRCPPHFNAFIHILYLFCATYYFYLEQ